MGSLAPPPPLSAAFDLQCYETLPPGSPGEQIASPGWQWEGEDSASDGGYVVVENDVPIGDLYP